MPPAADATTRFSNRVADYIRFRPGYPPELLQTLQSEARLNPQSAVADIGSGTGISSDIFLQSGCTVFGIEPNTEMRTAAEARFVGVTRFHSLSATAEATTLPDVSVDFVVAGQAFHWFDRDLTRTDSVKDGTGSCLAFQRCRNNVRQIIRSPENCL